MIRSSAPAMLAALGLAACAPTAPAGEAPPTAAPSAPAQLEPQPVTAASQVMGNWDVVSFDGYTPDFRMSGESRTAFADFRSDGVGLRIGCNWSGRSGKVRGSRFVADNGEPPIQTAMGCGEEPERRDAAYWDFFTRSPLIERLGDDRLRLTAGNSVLVLERPEVRRLAFVPTRAALEGKWRLLAITRFGPQGGRSGIGLSEIPGRVVIGDGRIAYNRCPAYAASFTYTADGRLASPVDAGRAATPTCKELSEPRWADMPAPIDVLTVIRSSPMAERVGDGLVLLTAGDLGLLLTQEPCTEQWQSDDHSRIEQRDCTQPE